MARLPACQARRQLVCAHCPSPLLVRFLPKHKTGVGLECAERANWLNA